MAIKAVIFDMDGVVVDSMPVFEKTDREFLKNKGIALSKEDSEKIKRLSGLRMQEIMIYIKDRFGLEGSIEDLISERRKIGFRMVGKELNTVDGFAKFVASIRKKYKTALTTSASPIYIEEVEKKLSILKN